MSIGNEYPKKKNGPGGSGDYTVDMNRELGRIRARYDGYVNDALDARDVGDMTDEELSARLQSLNARMEEEIAQAESLYDLDALIARRRRKSKREGNEGPDRCAACGGVFGDGEGDCLYSTRKNRLLLHGKEVCEQCQQEALRVHGALLDALLATTAEAEWLAQDRPGECQIPTAAALVEWLPECPREAGEELWNRVAPLYGVREGRDAFALSLSDLTSRQVAALPEGWLLCWMGIGLPPNAPRLLDSPERFELAAGDLSDRWAESVRALPEGECGPHPLGPLVRAWQNRATAGE